MKKGSVIIYRNTHPSHSWSNGNIKKHIPKNNNINKVTTRQNLIINLKTSTMTFKAKKPKGTFYSDYNIQNGAIYAIFEHGSRVSNIKMGETSKTNKDWKDFDVQETDTELIINLKN